jgi:hypothetical protein
MTTDDTTKQAVLKLLRRGQVTQAEAARLAGRSRQIVRHWAKDLPADAREQHLTKLWQRVAGKRS